MLESFAIHQLADTDETLSVDLSDGRIISIVRMVLRPLYSSIEGGNYHRLIANNNKICWNKLDEDIYS